MYFGVYLRIGDFQFKINLKYLGIEVSQEM